MYNQSKLVAELQDFDGSVTNLQQASSLVEKVKQTLPNLTLQSESLEDSDWAVWKADECLARSCFLFFNFPDLKVFFEEQKGIDDIARMRSVFQNLDDCQVIPLCQWIMSSDQVTRLQRKCKRFLKVELFRIGLFHFLESFDLIDFASSNAQAWELFCKEIIFKYDLISCRCYRTQVIFWIKFLDKAVSVKHQKHLRSRLCKLLANALTLRYDQRKINENELFIVKESYKLLSEDLNDEPTNGPDLVRALRLLFFRSSLKFKALLWRTSHECFTRILKTTKMKDYWIEASLISFQMAHYIKYNVDEFRIYSYHGIVRCCDTPKVHVAYGCIAVLLDAIETRYWSIHRLIKCLVCIFCHGADFEDESKSLVNSGRFSILLNYSSIEHTRSK
jgi:hypothetical protein